MAAAIIAGIAAFPTFQLARRYYVTPSISFQLAEGVVCYVCMYVPYIWGLRPTDIVLPDIDREVESIRKTLHTSRQTKTLELEELTLRRMRLSYIVLPYLLSNIHDQ